MTWLTAVGTARCGLPPIATRLEISHRGHEVDEICRASNNRRACLALTAGAWSVRPQQRHDLVYGASAGCRVKCRLLLARGVSPMLLGRKALNSRYCR